MNFFFANAFFLLHCCIFIGRYRSLRTRFLIGLLDVTQMNDTMRVLEPYAGSKTLLWLTRWNLRKWKNLRFRQNAMTRSMITCRNSIEVSTLLFSLPSFVVYSAICMNSAWVSISSFNGKFLWHTRESLKIVPQSLQKLVAIYHCEISCLQHDCSEHIRIDRSCAVQRVDSINSARLSFARLFLFAFN